MRDSCRRSTLSLLPVVVLCLALGNTRATDLLEQYAQARDFDPVFQAALQEREIAGQLLRESKAGMLPAISADLEFGQTYQNIRESNNILFTPGTSDFFDAILNFSLTQPIYRSDLFARIPRARAEVRQAIAIFAAAEDDLILRLTQAYFESLAAHDNLEFAVAEREAIGRQLEETEERRDAGLAPITDLHDARSRFALAQAAEIDARDALEESRQAIAEITGELPFDIELLSESFPLVKPDRSDAEAWVEAATFQNPTIKALEAAVDIADREIQLQRAPRLPALDLVATHNRSDTGGSIFAGGGGSDIARTNLRMRLSIPIFDGGRSSARTKSAKLQRRIALQELERQKRQVERETRAAFRGLMSGITRVEALQKSVFSYQAALAAKEQGLRSGLNTGLDVLDARRELFSARRDLAQARYVYILDNLRLKRSVGVLDVDDLAQINAYLQ